jgi:site-specific DNA-methyltransferase (adenine-specific)
MLVNNIFKRRTPDILECIANLSSDEVFTPPQMANSILDLLPKDVWSNKDLKFLDPGCKTGIFLRECAKRLMAGLESTIPDEDKRREHIFKNMLYGISITDITSLMSRRSLYYSKSGTSKNAVVKFDNEQGNILYENIRHTFEKRKCIFCGAPEELLGRVEGLESHAYQFIHQDINAIFDNMKFDVIIGNPPYQLESGGYGAQATPIYQKFIDIAMELKPRYISMIIPSRWFAGGMGLNDFRAKMLGDKRLKVLVDHPNSDDCFPGVEIKGGVCYFLWDSKHNGECEVISMFGNEEVSRATRKLDEHDTFIRFNESIEIIKKVKAKNEATFDLNVLGIDPFKFPTNFTNYKEKYFKDAVKLYLRGGVGYVDKNQIKTNTNLIDKYKILISQAYNGGDQKPHQIMGVPFIAEPHSCNTFTYLVLRVCENEKKAKNTVKYLKTRFARFLISQKKITQHLSKDRFTFVPDLDMSLEWSDEKLFERYNINEKEQEFIKSIVKEMA